MATAADHAAARHIAEATGELLVAVRDRMFRLGADTWTVRDTGDLEAHDFIVGELRRQFPDDGILSEEGRDDLARLHKERVWIVDPLDGTREFSEPGRTDWAVHIALAENGVPTAGAVALPENIGAGDHIEFGSIGAYSLSGRTDFNGFYSDAVVEIVSTAAAPPKRG